MGRLVTWRGGCNRAVWCKHWTLRPLKAHANVSMIVNTFNSFNNARIAPSFDEWRNEIFSANFILRDSFDSLRFSLIFRETFSIDSENKDGGFWRANIERANIVIPRIYPLFPLWTRPLFDRDRELILAEEDTLPSPSTTSTKRESWNNKLVSFKDAHKFEEKQRGGVIIIGFDYIYIYMYMLVRLDDYRKTVKLLQFSWSPSNTCCRLLTGQIDRCENSPF